MSILNQNISIRIREIRSMSWEVSSVNVAPRPYHALVFRLQGRASFSNGNQSVSTNSGDVFYMPANYPYKAEYQEKNEILVIHFESGLSSEMENFKLNNSHIVSALFRKIYDIWTGKAEGYYYAALSVMGELLENILLQQSPALSNKTVEAFENALEYMEENYKNSEFTVGNLVKKANMSDTYFRKLFLRKFGMSPAKYVISRRLIYADKLLSAGEYSISEAAEMSGFSDVKYFSRVVKKEYGVTPSELYRHIKRG